MDLNFLSPNKLSKQTTKHKHTMSSDFRQILANQHNKQFHLIDHPDLVFQLANHNFATIKQHQQQQNKTKFSIQQRKFHRHKSQQQTNNADNYIENFLINKKNTPQLITPNRIDSPSQFKQQNKGNDKQIKMKRIDFVRQKQNSKIQTTKQQQEIIQNFNKSNILQKQGIESKTRSPLQKQSMQQKILSLNRPLTSNSKLLVRQKQQQLSGRGWRQNFERKKYSELKKKLSGLIGEIESCEELRFSQVFEYQQVILRDYLSLLVAQMKKQCVQKGDLIQMIWNTLLVLINKVMRLMVDEKKIVQKSQIQEQLNLHSSYQQMYLFQTTKIKQLGKKYNESKNVIDRLIYQLRYKRKQVRKLSKNLAICNDKLNEYKVEHIDLQNQHIDLLIDAKQINQQQAQQLLTRKLQVNKLKFQKQKLHPNKNQLKQIIQQQLQDQKLHPIHQEKFKNQLLSKINNNTQIQKKKKTAFIQNQQQTHLVQQFIQKFSSKFIPPTPQNDDNQSYKLVRKPHKAHTAINTDFDFKSKNQSASDMTQTTFSDKIQFDIINTISTQTPGTQKIKKMETVSVQADGDQMKIILTKARMMAYHTMDLSFYFDIKKQSKHQQRKSSLLFKKQYKNNKSISQISSDGSLSKQKNTNQKRQSKSLKKNDKKNSILNSTLQNYSNFRQNSSKIESGKNGTEIKKTNKKRVTEIPHIQHLNTQESQTLKRQSRSKKRTYQSPSSFQQQKMNNRTSICVSNFESSGGSISMNEQKQKYIENFIMNKDQQFEVLKQNAIMQTYKNYLKDKRQKKSSFFNGSKKNIRNSLMAQDQCKITNLDSDLSQQQNLTPKQALSSCDKLKQSGFKRGSRKGSELLSSSLKKQKNQSYQVHRKSIKQEYFLNQIIEFTVRKSLIKRKLDPSNFNQCKQKSEFVSITQKLDPFMLDVEYLMNQNFNRKKKPNLINIKSVNKFIMMTYSRSIDKMYRNNYLLQNLIKPLYECFQMIYGALKPQQIYKKMVSAISDIMSVKQNQNFKQFIFFLGLQKDNDCSPYLTTFDICMYLKLLEKLNAGGKFTSQIDGLYTSKWKVNAELTKILQSEHLPQQVIYKIENKIMSILNKLQDYVRESIDSEGESKINLFKVSRMIVQEIIKLRINALEKLQTFIIGSKNQETLLNSNPIQKVRNSYFNCEEIKTVIDCCRISTTKKLYFSKILEQLSVKQENESKHGKKIKKSELGILLARIGLIDFTELQVRMKYIHENNPKADSNLNGQKQGNLSDIQKLSIVEIETNKILNEILGQMESLYEFGLLKGLQGLNNF